MTRNIVYTVRPSGNAGDQEDATVVSATVTNAGGAPIVAVVSIAAQSLGNTGAGSRAFDAVEVFAKASVALGVGATLDNMQIVMIQGVTENNVSNISGSGGWESTGAKLLDPTGVAWTGTLLDSLAVRVDATVTLPAGIAATLNVKEIRAEALDFYHAAAGLAGLTVADGEAGAVAAGGLAQ